VSGSSESEAGAGGALRYDASVPYAAALDRLLLPRLRIDVQFFAGQRALMPVLALLDTGAEFVLFDGRVVEQAGLSETEVRRRALDVKPIYGFARRGAAVEGYLHEITCYVGFGARFAELRFRAIITPPNTLAFPVLGRAGFFEQVDVTFVELEKMLYLRFRDPAVQTLFD
jgi:hypothetical protein